MKDYTLYKTKVDNYRPVIRSALLLKVFEYVIRDPDYSPINIAFSYKFMNLWINGKKIHIQLCADNFKFNTRNELVLGLTDLSESDSKTLTSDTR